VCAGQFHERRTIKRARNVAALCGWRQSMTCLVFGTRALILLRRRRNPDRSLGIAQRTALAADNSTLTAGSTHVFTAPVGAGDGQPDARWLRLQPVAAAG